jgi:hypothetical protein
MCVTLILCWVLRHCLSVVILSVVMVSVVMLSVVMLKVVILSVVMLDAVVQSVVAPFSRLGPNVKKLFCT